jgi:calcineurin-like phosphoesterase family protein
MIYFISDTHFNHNFILHYSNRPFDNLKKMEEEIIKNWNETVKDEDEIYILGDFSFGDKAFDLGLLRSLNGIKKLIIGNHDKKHKEVVAYWRVAGFEEVFLNPIVLDNYFILSHEPINGINNTQIFANIHGHTHEICLTNGNYFNVSVEAIGYKPISFDFIKNYFAKREMEN